MQQHPLSAAFPAMPADQFEVLKDSISSIGVQEPITLFEGMVLDGWHRWTAAEEVGQQCPTVDLGDVDPQDFVIAKNKARRHITSSQIAAAVVAVYQWRAAGRNPAPGAELAKSTKQLAEIAGVGTRTIEHAKAVESKATPVVKAAVKAGTMSVKKAAETVKPAKPVVEDIQYEGPSQDEIDEAMASAKEDLTTLHKLLEADDKLAVLVAENDQLRAELAVVKLARDGYMNRSNELISRVKWLKNKLAKAEADV